MSHSELHSGERRPLVIAHRGKTGTTPENAMSSLRALEAAGADLVELDIRLSLDRVPVVFHDAFLGRTTRGRGWIRMWPAALLRRLRLRDSDDHISTLTDMLRAFPVTLQPALHVKDRAAVGHVLDAIARDGDPDRTWLWLDHTEDVRRATRRSPTIDCTLLRPGGWTEENRDGYVRDARDCGARAISLPWGMITTELTGLAHAYGLLAFSRQEASPSLVANIRSGLDGIITIEPETAASLIGKGHTVT